MEGWESGMNDREGNRRGAHRRDFILLALAGCAAMPSKAAPAPVVLGLGDSMSAEYRLARGSGWLALLQERLADQKMAATVINASVSGDTTAGGRSRLQALLQKHQPALVVIELGGNDALRGLPLQGTEDNLARMVQQAQAARAKVLLVGMQVPPNYGTDYARRFAPLFATIAKAHEAALVPFLLAGVADGPEPLRLFQADRIHPNARAQPLMMENVWKVLAPMLR